MWHLLPVVFDNSIQIDFKNDQLSAGVDRKRVWNLPHYVDAKRWGRRCYKAGCTACQYFLLRLYLFRIDNRALKFTEALDVFRRNYVAWNDKASIS